MTDPDRRSGPYSRFRRWVRATIRKDPAGFDDKFMALAMAPLLPVFIWGAVAGERSTAWHVCFWIACALGVVIFIFCFGQWLLYTARKGDKTYNLVTRKMLSKEYQRDPDEDAGSR